jgi:hypothetical protein
MKEYCTPLDSSVPPNSVYQSFGEELFRVTFDCASIGSALIACDGPCLLVNPALIGDRLEGACLRRRPIVGGAAGATDGARDFVFLRR